MISVPQIYAIDQAATFERVMWLSSEPKTRFGSDDQETTKDGVPKWEVQLVASFRQFGRSTNEIIKVGLTSPSQPGKELGPAEPVQLVGFEIGVMDKKNREGQIVGAQVWYRCQEVRSIAATGPRGKTAEAS